MLPHDHPHPQSHCKKKNKRRRLKLSIRRVVFPQIKNRPPRDKVPSVAAAPNAEKVDSKGFQNNSNDSSEKLYGSDKDRQSSVGVEDEDDSRVFSLEYSDDVTPNLLKRKYQEDQNREHEDSNDTIRPNKWSSAVITWDEHLEEPSKRSRKSRNEDIEKWNQHLEELKRFKAKYGHCRLTRSSDYGGLYNWLQNQGSTSLNPNHSRFLKDVSERERRSKELESVLGQSREHEDSNDTIRPRKWSITWDEHLEELKRFKAKYGHCRVPRSSDYIALYNWLQKQRNMYLNPNHSRFLKDVSERERRTEELELVLGASRRDWTSRPRTISTTEAEKWDASLEELKKFKAEHGHREVPCSFGSVRKWLTKQRAERLNPNHSRYLKDVAERERRTKELELVLDESRRDWANPNA